LLEQIAAPGCAEVAIDLGTGDGAYVVRTARAAPRRFVIGVDANADNLAEASRKAAGKPARGGLANALFVHASVEALPDELAGIAGHVTVLFPWGSLLRAVAGPDPAVLAGIRRLCRAGASLEVTLGYDAVDAKGTAGLAPLSRERLDDDVLPAYREAGFAGAAAPLGAGELRRCGTTWAARLAFGHERRFWRLRATAF
jgi:16S rRNA (adenine(1408)-N(1))-methyltransferase